MKPTGGGPQIVPIPPPTSLFPGTTNTLGLDGPKAANTGIAALERITKGLDVNKIYQSIKSANAQNVKEGAAQVAEQFGAQGLASSTARGFKEADYYNQNSKDLSATLANLSFEGEKLKMGGAEMLTNMAMTLGTSFAPTAVVTDKPAGQSIFSQIASAGEAAMSLFLTAALIP